MHSQVVQAAELCAEATRKGKPGGQPPGDMGRANSTPGSLWLDSKAEVVAGEEHRLSDHVGPVLCLALCGSRLYSSSTDFSIKASAAGCVALTGSSLLTVRIQHALSASAHLEAHQDLANFA